MSNQSSVGCIGITFLISETQVIYVSLYYSERLDTIISVHLDGLRHMLVKF